MKRNIFTRFIKNKNATAEIIGTVLLIIILIFFFGNVFLYNNEVNRIADEVSSKKRSTHITIDGISEENPISFNLTNRGGVNVYLDRLWINNDNEHGYYNLDMWIEIGSSIEKVLNLKNEAFYKPDGTEYPGYPQEGLARFIIITNTGDIVSDTITINYPNP